MSDAIAAAAAAADAAVCSPRDAQLTSDGQISQRLCAYVRASWRGLRVECADDHDDESRWRGGGEFDVLDDFADGRSVGLTAILPEDRLVMTNTIPTNDEYDGGRLERKEN
jgi:hypothetical protein